MLSQEPQQIVYSLPSAFDLFRRAWFLYKKRFFTYLGVVIIPMTILFLSAIIFLGSEFSNISSLPSKITSINISSLIIWAILFFTFNIWQQTALIYAIKDSEEGIGVIEAYKRGWSKILSYWWILFLSITITFVGFLFFIVPGIILGIWFSFAQFILINEDLKGTKALSKSKSYVNGKWVQIFLRFSFIFILLFIISILANFIIGFLHISFGQKIINFVIELLMTPLSIIYSFSLYNSLRPQKEEFISMPSREKSKVSNRKNLFIYFLVFAIFIGSILISFKFGMQKGNLIGRKEGLAACEVCPPEDLDFSLFWESWKTLKDNFYDQNKFDIQKMIYGAISGMVSSVGDPYTVFLNPEERKEFIEDTEGIFEGIGAEVDKKKEEVLIVAPLENSPAKKAGLRPGDKILEIDNIITTNLTIDEAVKLIRGPKGTEVILTIIRDGWDKPKEIKIVRDTIVVPSLKWEIKDTPNGEKVAYIKLYQFSLQARPDFSKAAIEILKSPAKKIILDLRDNPGGYVDVVQNICGSFLRNDTLVAIQDFGEGKEKTEFKAAGNEELLSYPVVILINHGSASGSEILAGALRDNRGVKLIGENSFGKGLVQQLFELKEGSSIKITIAKWLTPKGESIIDKGLGPGIKVEMTEKDYEKDLDLQLDKALEVIEGIR